MSSGWIRSMKRMKKNTRCLRKVRTCWWCMQLQNWPSYSNITQDKNILPEHTVLQLEGVHHRSDLGLTTDTPIAHPHGCAMGCLLWHWREDWACYKRTRSCYMILMRLFCSSLYEFRMTLSYESGCRNQSDLIFVSTWYLMGKSWSISNELRMIWSSF